MAFAEHPHGEYISKNDVVSVFALGGE